MIEKTFLIWRWDWLVVTAIWKPLPPQLEKKVRIIIKAAEFKFFLKTITLFKHKNSKILTRRHPNLRAIPVRNKSAPRLAERPKLSLLTKSRLNHSSTAWTSRKTNSRILKTVGKLPRKTSTSVIVEREICTSASTIQWRAEIWQLSTLKSMEQSHRLEWILKNLRMFKCVQKIGFHAI